jgi:ribonucleoside-diphosphate reductase alpha chain
MEETADVGMKHTDADAALERSSAVPFSHPIADTEKVAPRLSDNAITVLRKRYLKKDENGNSVETPEEMFWRVAENIAQAEKISNPEADVEGTALIFYNIMARQEFIPNSPTLMNAGRELQQLAACFVLPVDDSMESIFQAVKDAALIHKSGGGTGFSFSRLRPKNDMVRTTKGVSSGPISFMTVFNAATETIKQGGTRRGANMAILRVDHPDILEFIHAKEDNIALSNFNISVSIPDSFMEAVLDDKEYPLINPHTKQIVGTLRARDVFNKIVNMAWKNGDPGIVFLDRINAHNPTPALGEIESTNPCGEQPLLPYEACNLGSVNLAKMLRLRNKHWEIDFEKLRRTVHTSIHFLDNVIDMSEYPLERVKEMAHGNRKVGLGVMGFADMLFRLEIAYNSEQALDVAEQVMSFISAEARSASGQLAATRGVFPNFEQSVYARPGGRRMRNATVTTIAPTGTISIIAGCSSGIEPLYALCFYRNVLDDQKLIEVHPIFKEVAQKRGFFSEQLMEKIAETGSIQEMANIPEDIRKVFVAAYDITPEWHVRHQAVFQKYTDNAVSKTVNFPHHATRQDIADVYIQAYHLGCKGVTVYRDGSRNIQVLNVGTGTSGSRKRDRNTESGTLQISRSSEGYSATAAAVPPPAPKPGVSIGCGKLAVRVSIPVGDSKPKSQENLTAEDLAHLSSKMRECLAQNHQPSQELKMRFPFLQQVNAENLPRLLYLLDRENGRVASTGQKPLTLRTLLHHSMLCCPECGTPMETQEGCLMCRSCGFSRCG